MGSNNNNKDKAKERRGHITLIAFLVAVGIFALGIKVGEFLA